MALGFGRKQAVKADTQEVSPHGVVETRDPELETGVYEYDVEKGASAPRKGSRVADPVVVDDASVVSVGRQMELEASNSIKYRTCTWQKVSFNPFSTARTLDGEWLDYLSIILEDGIGISSSKLCPSFNPKC